jgi:hypothetical protein
MLALGRVLVCLVTVYLDAPPCGYAMTTAPAPGGVSRFSAVHFVVALGTLLVTLPFLDQLEYGVLIEAVLITVVLLSAVLAVGGRRRTLVIAAVLVSPSVVGRWVDHFYPGLIPRHYILLAAVVFVGFVIAHLLGFILRAPVVNAEVMCAAVATYLMIALLWAFTYMLVWRLAPGSFATPGGTPSPDALDFFEFLYFSVCTLTTVGYGDVIPTSKVMRMLAMMEATTGVFYLAVLISRLVSLYSSDRPSRPGTPPQPGAGEG